MAKNRAHNESPRKLIEDTINGNPVGAVSLLILSINNFLNNEIVLTVNQEPPQTSLLFMGIHSSALTMAELFFGKDRPENGYKKFLQMFIDGDTKDKQFSLIAGELHAWRNILVHGWLSSRGHNIEYDYEMEKGYERSEDTLYINPKVYLALYLKAFTKNGRIWQYIGTMSKKALLDAQNTIKQKYIR